MSNFLPAAASYFGLADADLRKVELFSDEHGPIVAFEVRLSDEDMAAVLKRAAEMKAEALAAPPATTAASAQPSEERMRAEYADMDKRTKSEFGSFARYRAWRLGQGAEQVADAAPAYVYLSPTEATVQQKAMAIGMDEKGNYAVLVEDLTEEQARRHKGDVPQARNVIARGDPAWPGPTSNADDFGGFPG